MIRKHKSYSRPRKPFDSQRIAEENKIKEAFGLKNKKEIWKTEAKLKVLRNRAKSLITSSEEERKQFFDKLKKMGLSVNNLSDILALTKEDLLGRRLQTIVFKKKIAPTSKSARQAITHNNILVNGKIVSEPSYWVPITLENSITLKSKEKIKPKNSE